jgi:putative Ca2+/H+ antiporter (TMEM165/GDT1 family)
MLVIQIAQRSATALRATPGGAPRLVGAGVATFAIGLLLDVILHALRVVAAVSVATLIVHAGSVLLGSTFALALPTQAIELAAGLAFFGFAGWTIRGDALGAADEDRAARTGRWAMVTIGTAFFLAELGDKTMLATVTLATTEEPVGTWLGSTAGMVVADVIAIAIGAILGTRLPERVIKVFAAVAFVVFGAILVGQALGVVRF